MEDGWNYSRKAVCQVANGVLGKKVRTAAWNIIKKKFMFNSEEKGLIREFSEV